MSNIVTKDARRCTRHVTNGQSTLAYLKVEGNRRARHYANQVTRQVAKGDLDEDNALFEPDFRIDGRDVS